jgi:hypothetical protein
MSIRCAQFLYCLCFFDVENECGTWHQPHDVSDTHHKIFAIFHDELNTTSLPLMRRQLVNMISENVPFLLPEEKKEGVVAWFKDQIGRKSKSLPRGSLQRRDVVLYPPGKCIHFYRDGVGISTVEVPCTLFNELDLARSMVDDHMVTTGYSYIITETMRTHLKQPGFQFDNNVMALRQGNGDCGATV